MPEISQIIINCLKIHYWIEVTALALLPVGADMNASVYKAQASDQKTYFVKWRQDPLPYASVLVLELLQAAGIQQLIAPVKTVEGESTQQVGDFTCIVYPFVQGLDGFSRPLTDQQWIVLGQTLKKVHEIQVPSPAQRHIRREAFSPRWRNAVRALYERLEAAPVEDEVSVNLKKFLRENRPTVLRLVDRSEQLSQKVRSQSLPFVLCHSDIHAGNILIGDEGALYIVDWDDPILAPKERDLMFIGGGVGNVWNQPQEEELFYRGYGQTDVDWTLLAYYRYERIVEDIALYVQELLFKSAEGKNRLEMYTQLTDMFAPNGVVDIAYKTDPLSRTH